MSGAILHTKPRVAIIGSGLSGSMLAHRLNGHCRVTVYERGTPEGAKPSDFAYSGNPVGLEPSFFYGLGGTTNLWTGGLIDMLEDEFKPSWPRQVAQALPGYYPDVVARVYGDEASAAWRARQPVMVEPDACLTGIYYPRDPFRVKHSDLFNGADIRHGCRIQRIEERAGRVRVTFDEDGALRHDHFDYVIVAAGGVNSPVILQRSGLGGAVAGQCHTDHPMGFVAKLANARNTALFETLRAKRHGASNTKAVMKLRDVRTGLWSAFYLRPASNLSFDSDPYARSFKFMGQSGTLRKYLMALRHVHEREFLYQVLENRLNIRVPSPYAYVLVINEQEDSGQGAVTIGADGRPNLHWEVSETARGAIARNLDSLARLLDAELHMPAHGFASRLYSGAHHSGTCRISSDPGTGVVDEQLKVHGAGRIYVCDGSVLPSTGASNTGLTIGALAYRLADHLKQEFAFGAVPVAA